MMFAWSCNCNAQGRTNSLKNAAQDTLPKSARELPLPEVPADMTNPEERASYILSRFWDGMDFTDTLRSHDRPFMEQNFVNFLSLFPHARPKTLPAHIGKMLNRAAADDVALHLIGDMAECYLNDTYSPMRNEDYFIIFLEEWIRLPSLPEYDRMRPAYLLESARKNRPGMKAADFTYTDNDGKKRTLHATRGKHLLLVFYDPACSRCSKILAELHKSAIIGNLTESKTLTVLAVYTEGDRKLWMETKDAMPQEWIVGIDDSHIVDHELYAVPAMPVIYLLDAGKRVILKDASAERIETWLSENNILQKKYERPR